MRESLGIIADANASLLKLGFQATMNAVAYSYGHGDRWRIEIRRISGVRKLEPFTTIYAKTLRDARTKLRDLAIRLKLEDETRRAINAPAPNVQSPELITKLERILRLARHPLFPDTPDLPAWQEAIDDADDALKLARLEGRA